jgi:hypothetical protein
MTPLVQEIEGSSPAFYRTFFEDGQPQAEQIADGLVIRHATSGRWYLTIPQPDVSSLKGHFDDWELYDRQAWKKLAGVELVFKDAAEATSAFTDFEDLDMRPALIERKYQELSIPKKYAEAVSENVTGATDQILKDIKTAGLDAEQIEDLQQRVLRLQMRVHDVQRRLEQLAAQAASLGFRLPLENETVKLPDGPEKPSDAGKLYRPYRRTARWTVDHTRQEIDWGLVAALAWLGPFALLALAAPKTVHEKRRYEKEVTDYEAVDTARDQLSAKRDALIEQGMQVFVFQQTPGGFATSDGMPNLDTIKEFKFVDR